jgi:acetate kinase
MITCAGSRTSAWVIPTDEDLMIALHAWTLLNPEAAARSPQRRPE